MSLIANGRTFNFFGLIYYVYPKKFELFWAWLLKKRDMGSGASKVQGTLQQSMHGSTLGSVLQGIYVTRKQGRVDGGVVQTVLGAGG